MSRAKPVQDLRVEYAGKALESVKPENRALALNRRFLIEEHAQPIGMAWDENRGFWHDFPRCLSRRTGLSRARATEDENERRGR